MRALSIRQPYAELILRGEKTIEYRSRPTKLIGARFYIYASRKWAGVDEFASPTNLLTFSLNGAGNALATGVIVGTAVISECRRENGHYCWHLSNVRRMKRPRKPKRMPQPVWFTPF
jgi:hypothetical protein